MTGTVSSDPRPPPAHIWAIILPYLRNPLPEPLSRPARSAFRQGALCSASRVSKLFHEICQPILYHTVVTDDLPLLLSQTELFSVRGNFAHTRHLFIEYSDKTFHTTYTDLIKHGREKWASIGLAPRAAQLRFLTAVKAELDSLTECLQRVNQLWHGKAMRWIFPRLETIAVGALLGTSYDDMFVEPEDKELLSDPAPCTEAFDEFLGSGKLKHLCVRDSVGPLAFATMSFASLGRPGGYTRTVHMSYLPKHFPFPLGHKIRFVADSSPSLDYAPTLRAIEKGMRTGSMVRKMQRRKGFGSPSDIVDIEICSSADCIRFSPLEPTIDSFSLPHSSNYPLRPVSMAEQTTSSEQFGGLLQEMFRRDSGLKDTVTWRRAGEQGVCRACGSDPPV